MWGATEAEHFAGLHIRISIHAPRVGRDGASHMSSCRTGYFNPRAPCGARQYTDHTFCFVCEFQSTRPVWGATAGLFCQSQKFFISIHAPRVGRDSQLIFDKDESQYFNPRAPCGARPLIRRQSKRTSYFNPRAPCGARHTRTDEERSTAEISIHAPRVGRDQPPLPGRSSRRHFNPRAPCGARLKTTSPRSFLMTFQSTRPVWGAT